MLKKILVMALAILSFTPHLYCAGAPSSSSSVPSSQTAPQPKKTKSTSILLHLLQHAYAPENNLHMLCVIETLLLRLTPGLFPENASCPVDVNLDDDIDLLILLLRGATRMPCLNKHIPRVQEILGDLFNEIKSSFEQEIPEFFSTLIETNAPAMLEGIRQELYAEDPDSGSELAQILNIIFPEHLEEE